MKPLIQHGENFSSWAPMAACKNIDPNVFFPFPNDDEGADVAKQICDRCPVRIPCLEYALDNNEKDGVWGGMSERERLRLARQRRSMELGRIVTKSGSKSA